MANLLSSDLWHLREAIRIASIRGGSVHVSRTMARRLLSVLRNKEATADLRAGIEALRDELGGLIPVTCGCKVCTRTKRIHDSLDALLGGAK